MGWYAVIRILVQPRTFISSLQSAASNCQPLSVVTVLGVPNLAVHPSMKPLATDSVVMSARGMASGQRVKRSMLNQQVGVASGWR